MILEIVQKIYKMKFLTAEIVKIGNSMNYFLKKKKKKTLNFFISSQLRKAIIDRSVMVLQRHSLSRVLAVQISFLRIL